MDKPAHVYYDRQEDVPHKRSSHLEISEGSWPPPRRQRNDLRTIERLESSKATLDQIDREGSTQLASLALGNHWKARDMLQDLNDAREKISSDESATHRHFVGVANPAEPTRRTILAHLAEAAFFLSSCMPSKQPKKSEEVPNLVISGPEDVSHMPFQRSRNVMARNSAKQKARRCRRHTNRIIQKPSPTNYARDPTLTRRKSSVALLKPTTTPISWHSLWTTTPNIASRIR